MECMCTSTAERARGIRFAIFNHVDLSERRGYVIDWRHERRSHKTKRSKLQQTKRILLIKLCADGKCRAKPVCWFAKQMQIHFFICPRRLFDTSRVHRLIAEPAHRHRQSTDAHSIVHLFTTYMCN